MARPRKIEELPDDRDLSGVLKSLQPDDGWIVKIYRIRQGGVSEWLASWAPTEVSEATIAEKWGGGKYTVRPWSDILNKWAPQKTVVISAEAAEEAGFEGESMPTVELNPYNRQDDRLVTFMQQSSDRQMQMMAQFNTAMMGLLTAVITGKQQIDPIELAKLMQGGSNPSSQLTMMKEMFALAKEIAPNGSGGESDPLISLATSLLPKFLESRTAPSGNAGPRVPQVPPSLPPPSSVSDVAKSPQSADDSADMHVFLFLRMLKEKIKRKADAAFWADYIEMNQDEDGPVRILGAIRNGVAFEQLYAGLCEVDAEFKEEQFRVWLERLYSYLKDPTLDREEDDNEGADNQN